ncbi:hypothetical protein TraAM80_05117 [Trypanosoma rangeli]|uniref:Uncharacterized protein n=1 Tax=Trypanosoma rangeli TaxID=5698 RepID=A0A422NG85_TRYRA|nr:uncharacterized protein TraAM80_05117 [Trypanosoma rangeli]RNF04470.1 hypothetical protein TraAM80_05117 [Trypanosoma rangeli]|eukprot:RNF04470.1 hypothetical protein TraAM80_05117 [Trypanosoma rangeli]
MCLDAGPTGMYRFIALRRDGWAPTVWARKRSAVTSFEVELDVNGEREVSPRPPHCILLCTLGSLHRWGRMWRRTACVRNRFGRDSNADAYLNDQYAMRCCLCGAEIRCASPPHQCMKVATYFQRSSVLVTIDFMRLHFDVL